MSGNETRKPVGNNGIRVPKRTGDDTHQERRSLRSLMEVTRGWIWEVDPEGRYTFSSRAVEDILGYSPGEVLGRTPFDFMPPVEAVRINRIFSAIATARRPFAGLENINLHKSGRKVILETSGVPIFSETGEFRGFRGIDRDMTARKRRVKDLRKRHSGPEKTTPEITLRQEIRTPGQILTEKALRRRERQLREKTLRLQEMNTALEVLLRKREQDKAVIQKRILGNIRRMVAPYLDALGETRLSERQRFLVELLKSNLRELMSPFAERLTSEEMDLTRKELEIANLVRMGKSTTQIAAALNMAYKTAETHRWRIRKKLGLTHKRADLMNHLCRLQDPADNDRESTGKNQV
jgi:PAS domain S-box-containing protein